MEILGLHIPSTRQVKLSFAAHGSRWTQGISYVEFCGCHFRALVAEIQENTNKL